MGNSHRPETVRPRMVLTRGGKSTLGDGEQSETSVDAGAGFPACLLTLEAEAGHDGDSSVVGSEAYLSMVKSPSKEVLKARSSAKEGKAYGIPILGEATKGKTSQKGPGAGAAAFSLWRIKIVSLFTNLYLLHCLFGFVIEGADNTSGNPFTSSPASCESSSVVFSKLVGTEEGKSRVMEDWATTWAILIAYISLEVHGSLVASIDMQFAGIMPWRKVSKLLDDLMVKYAPSSARASAAAYRCVLDLAEKPVKCGHVNDRVEEILAAARTYEQVHGSSLLGSRQWQAFVCNEC